MDYSASLHFINQLADLHGFYSNLESLRTTWVWLTWFPIHKLFWKRSKSKSLLCNSSHWKPCKFDLDGFSLFFRWKTFNIPLRLFGCIILMTDSKVQSIKLNFSSFFLIETTQIWKSAHQTYTVSEQRQNYCQLMKKQLCT